MDQGADANGRDLETLQLYVEESLEGLQQIDQLLLEAERGTPTANLMATLFRTVHTIKGTAGYLAFERTQALAHTAEDLLSRLRDGKLVGRPAHFTCLLAVGECLRQMVENVRTTGEEGEVEVAALVTELRALMAAPAPTEAAANPAANAVAAPSSLAPPAVEAAPVAPLPSPAVAVTAAPGPQLVAGLSAAALAAPVTQAGADELVRAARAAAAATAAAAEEARAAKAAPPTATPAAASPAAAAPATQAAPNTPAAAAKGDPEADAANKERSAAARNEQDNGTVRVNVTVLDRLMNLIGELVLARNQIMQITSVSTDTKLAGQAAFQRLNVVTGELQEQVMKTRMQPVSRVFEKIPRMVRDVARVVNKKVDCVIEGNNTEIDKALVEAIRDPVMHIVRNALDHGVEPPEDRVRQNKSEAGTLHIRAAHKGGAVTIEIEDDGRGMDPVILRAHALRKGVITQAEADRLSDRDALELVFRPGFSTAAAVTDISGRGVGMDVVRTHVRQAGGEAEIESVVGRGTTIRLKMPLTLAIIPALLVRAGGQRFAIPQVNLLELVYLSEERAAADIEVVRGAAVHKLRGEILPVVHLREALGLPALRKEEAAPGTYCVVLASGARRYSLVVDAIENTEEIVIKPLRGQLKRLICYSGATVLGDGDVALILDAAGIASKAGIDLQARRHSDQAAVSRVAHRREAMMIFRSAGGVQCAVPLSMVARLEQVPSQSIEEVGGREVLQYRGDLLSVVRPDHVLSPQAVTSRGSEQLLLVFDFGQPIGMAVEEVLDVVEVDLATAAMDNDNAYAYGKAVVYGRTTLLIDIYRVMRDLLPNFFQARSSEHRTGRVLVAEPTPALRSSLVGYLRAQGMHVTSVPSAEGLATELRGKTGADYDALVVDEELLRQHNDALLAQLSNDQPDLPVLAWSGQSSEQTIGQTGGPAQAGVRGTYNKRERERLFAALQEFAKGDLAARQGVL